MYSHLKSILLVCVLILTIGCGGGGGDDSGTIPPNPPADPPPIAEAPCDLTYPDSVLLIQAGGDISGFSPSVDCGTPDAYSISPELPTGMMLEADTGVISGSPLDEIYFDTHTITATNDIGSAEIELVIDVRPFFEFTAEPHSGTYSGLDGSGSLSVSISLTEDPFNPSFPDPVSGVNFVLAHPNSMLEPVSITYSQELMDLNSGNGPLIDNVSMQPEGIIFFAVLGLVGTSPDFSLPTPLIEVVYETKQDQFVGSTGDIFLDFEWQENSPFTPTPNDLFITLESLEGVPANAVDFTATMQRID